MPKIIKILKYLLILISMVIITDCAAAKQNPWQKKRTQASKVHTSQLGRNRFYFSPGYQKKLIQSVKKK
jgi:hypothetical protein